MRAGVGKVGRKVLLSWSGGKDSAMTLDELRRMPDVEVAGLLTTVTEGYDRISMHGVRRVLLEQQAGALGLPLERVDIPPTCINEVYESRMRDMLLRNQRRGVNAVAFGDLFLDEVRRYRETNMARVGMEALFPVWGRDTLKFYWEFLQRGYKGIAVCADTRQIPVSFAGRIMDERFLADLPAQADPCGENGEFHSFVFDGPLFREPVDFEIGEVVVREQFAFCDLLPASQNTSAFSNISRGAAS
jgi:uncharacterized protein (TIGR00290 family)